MRINTKDQNAWQWIGFAVIAFFVVLVYAPSLMHVPRSDQLMYFIEIGARSSWQDLVFGAFDLNRHRVFAPGDEILFRPVHYIVLGLEKYFFHYNFLLWQGLGICLHLGVVWFLLRLLLTVSVGFPAVICTAFFGLMFTNMEMVVWQHINSYMICAMCMLIALRRAYLILAQNTPSLKHYIVLSVSLLLGSFTHEMANPAAIGFFAALWLLKPHERKWSIWLLAVPLIYVLASLLNAWLHPFSFRQALPPTFKTGLFPSIANWFYAMGTWLYAGLFPGELKWLFASRNMIDPDEKSLIKMIQLNHIPALLAFLSVSLYGVCSWKHLQRSGNKVWVGLGSFALAFVFAGIIAVGRGNQVMMWDILRVNTYYMYMFWVLMSVGFFVCMDWGSVHAWPKRLLGLVLCLLIVFNAGKLYKANDKQARDNNDILIFAQTLSMLVDQKKDEPGFSFYVDPKYPGNYIYKEMRRIDDPPNRRYTFAEALYPQYYTKENPKYKFLARE